MGGRAWEGRKDCNEEVVGPRKTYFAGKEGTANFRASTGQCGFSSATAGVQ